MKSIRSALFIVAAYTVVLGDQSRVRLTNDLAFSKRSVSIYKNDAKILSFYDSRYSTMHTSTSILIDMSMSFT